MTRVIVGDLFESNAQTLVNTVNCVGVMGKGVALEFKRRFPEMFADYAVRCAHGGVRLGRPYLFKTLIPPWILNFPTKKDWRSLSKMEDIIAGLKYLVANYEAWGITSLAVPPLGCGNGQLEWRVVGPTLYRYLNQMRVPVALYAPHGTPADQLDLEFLDHGLSASPLLAPDGKMEPGCVALVEILSRIDSEPYHWPIGRTAFQKIAYFATNAGIDTGLTFVRSSFGPFAPGLKRLIASLQNHALIREHELGKMFAVRPGPTSRDATLKYRVQLDQWEDAIERITDLFLRMHTKEAEIAATVHFVANELCEREKHKPSERVVFEEVKRWKQRRRPALDDSEIAGSIRNLAALGWLQLEASADLPLKQDFLAD